MFASIDGRDDDRRSGQGGRHDCYRGYPRRGAAAQRWATRPRGAPVTALRIVLGEDSYLAREGIMRALEEVGDVDVVATCSDLDDLRATIDAVEPDVVLTDIRMPPTNTDEGIRLAGELRESHPEIGVVVLSQHAEPLYAVSLFENGSGQRAYLLKERLKDEGELSRALQEVADGGSVVDPYIVERLVGAQSGTAGSRVSKLTPREREILALIAEGRSNAAIARTLFVTTRAVERHINAIFARLELAESAEANRRVQAVLVYLAGLGAG
jgi:DNA-binding NarL/FixJ family response regulator